MSVIKCNCEKCKISLNENKIYYSLFCGCEDCRQAGQWGYSKGGPLPDRLQKLIYVRSDIPVKLLTDHVLPDKIEAILGIHVERLMADHSFDYYYTLYSEFLPSPQMRWCTKELKIIPFEKAALLEKYTFPKVYFLKTYTFSKVVLVKEYTFSESVPLQKVYFFRKYTL